jgi:heat-inducible transcriptional repressor
VVVVTSMGVAAQQVVEWSVAVEADALTRLSNALNAALGGKVMEDIRVADIDAVCDALGSSSEVRHAVQQALRSARHSEPNLAAAGAQNLLDQPEFHDLRKLRSILRIVEEQKVLYDLIADDLSNPKSIPSVRIGAELGSDDIAECSVVTMPYRFGDRGVGLLAILGPRRMPYGRLMSLAAGTADSLGTYLDNVEIR